MIRKPVVAGRFYPGEEDALRAALEKHLSHSPVEDAKAIIAPHAGYMYSGEVAGSVYARVRVPERVFLIGPNHTGLGKRVSVWREGEWDTPLGSLKIDEVAASMLIGGSKLFSADTEAHLFEHSLEVQLPFILARNPVARIVPVTILRADEKDCLELGRALARTISGLEGDSLIIASTDMSHYEQDGIARQKDRLAIDSILALDAAGLLEVTSKEDISMCGAVPAAIAIVAARELGATKTALAKYATSGEVNGDLGQVVGYAGIIIC
ncbi:MAG: AmmeMemoRadiSam system protein B [Deltaproteobacteria bacterium]|nr:AmmeMemoRadiSam system protein B [Deltaproteobacteria bacterium]MBZ0220599.1 AmmeMemoRadiSam system protein B [Deltaproteobacteria bacterium]